jgi:hypothetical protein
MFPLWLSLIGVLIQPASLRAGTLLEASGMRVWKYLDDGSEADAAWQQPGFDDWRWNSRKAPLG